MPSIAFLIIVSILIITDNINMTPIKPITVRITVNPTPKKKLNIASNIYKTIIF